MAAEAIRGARDTRSTRIGLLITISLSMTNPPMRASADEQSHRMRDAKSLTVL
uniref:Uncharacterized protein n=1 Tax=Arundo donax TaxID=35708 RepID=A0A0A9E946_ARUDO